MAQKLADPKFKPGKTAFTSTKDDIKLTNEMEWKTIFGLTRDIKIFNHMAVTRPPMTKSQWNDKYKILDKAHSDFLLELPQYKNGKNAKSRTQGERKVDQAIGMSRMLIECDSELLGFFASTEYGFTFAYDEFFQARHFGRDMGNFLKELRQYIDSLPDDPTPTQ